MNKLFLIFIVSLLFNTVVYAKISNKKETPDYKVKEEDSKLVINNGSKSDTIKNLNKFIKKYSSDKKKLEKSRSANEKKIRDLTNDDISLKESYQFKVDTTKYSLPVRASAFNFKRNQVVVAILDKDAKESNSSGYSFSVSNWYKGEKAILLFDCENKTEPKRFGTTGKSREAFGKTHILNFDDDKIISFQINKIGVWSSNSTLEKLFEVGHSFSGNKFIVKDENIYGSGSWDLLLDSLKSCAKFNFKESKYEEGTYEISSSKAFYDISDFERRYNIKKLFDLKDKKINNINRYRSTNIVSGTSILSKGEDSFFLLNNSGKAILEMDYDLNIINSYPLNELVERRDIELKDITLQDLTRRSKTSRLMNLFYNKYKKQFLIQIDNSKFMMEKGLPDREI
ncbi:MAG: hypothetical protein CSA15_09320, partial [Candidatus Delongbacteria bacterium]